MLGLNRAETDYQTKDGNCSVLHNLRYEAGAWHNVNGFRVHHPIRDYGGFTLIYKHPTTADDLYIAKDGTGTIHEVRLTDGVCVSTQQIRAATNDLQHIFSFGNVLTLVTPEAEYYYVLFSGQYVLFNMPVPPSVAVKNMGQYAFQRDYYYHVDSNGYTLIHRDDFNSYRPGGGGQPIEYPPQIAENGFSFITLLANVTGQAIHLADHSDKYWLGEIVVMAAYKMKDGTVVSNSELMILTPELDNQTAVNAAPYKNTMDRNKIKGLDENTWYLFLQHNTKSGVETNNFYICPTLTLTIGDDVDKRLIESVALYSTRLNPLYDLEIWKEDSDWEAWEGDQRSTSFLRLYEKKNDLLNQPLYCIKEIPIDELDEGTTTVELNYILLTEAPTKPVFEPTQSLHGMTAQCYFEYNSRLHKANLDTTLFEGYSAFCTTEDSLPVTQPGGSTFTPSTWLATTVEIDDNKQDVCRRLSGKSPVSLSRVISYPDYRATRFGVFVDEQPQTEGHPIAGAWRLDVTMQPCAANNYAYAILPSTSNVKYPAFELTEPPAERGPLLPENRVRETNRVQVSALNNMFSLPFENSYRVGNLGENILSLATVADELSSTRFGAFPLYVFTDKGVWSLESGSNDVLYSNIIPVNHDRITNPMTCAAAYAVFYVTSRGLYALQGRKSQLISLPLGIGEDRLQEYLQTADIHYQFKYGDLIVFNKNHPYAYVYSVSKGVWSSRDMAGTVLNNDEIVTSEGIRLLDDEAPQGAVECMIVTRPLKFGNTEFKRLETLIARIESSDCYAHVTVEGSHDGRTWIGLRDAWKNITSRDILLRRTAMSCRFFRLKIHLTAHAPLSIFGVDAEYYLRFTGRLR